VEENLSMAKILVVDDELHLREMLRDILEMADFEVVTAENGEQGLEKLRSESPDLLLLDCSMPVMDGYETLERMRRDTMLVNMPVIMLTVLNSEQDEIKGLRFGVDDYITKPFKPSLLMARVRKVLDRQQLSISANPLTQLAGNAVIKTEAEKRLVSGVPFAMVYIDLDYFKSYNDKYGFYRGDEIIKHTAGLLIRAVKAGGGKGDFVGHIGGDDFIIITAPEKAPGICQSVISEFDSTVPAFYDQEDRQRGYIMAPDRSNVVHRFSLMTISLAVVSTEHQQMRDYGELVEIAAELKKQAKAADKSAWVTNTGSVSR
jgi:diguanylate cyclase (GGDEF)-like protein